MTPRTVVEPPWAVSTLHAPPKPTRMASVPWAASKRVTAFESRIVRAARLTT